MEDRKQYDLTSSSLPKVIQIDLTSSSLPKVIKIDHIKTFDDIYLVIGIAF